MKPTIDQIREVCSDDVDRPNLAAPFACRLGGEPWIVGTDGRCALAVRATEEEAAAHVIGGAPDFAAVVRWPLPSGVVVGVEALRAWAVVRGEERRECELCEGAGTHECDCGDVHACSVCEGCGTEIAPFRDRCAVIRRAPSVYVDALVVRRAVGWLIEGDVEVAVEGPVAPVVFRSVGTVDWFAVVMPMRDSVAEEWLDTAGLAALLPAVRG